MTPARVLVAVGDPVIAQDMAQLLQRIGHVTVAIAARAAEALLLAPREQPDLILLDTSLEGSADAANRLRASGTIAVILLMASSGEFLPPQETGLAPFGRLARPFDGVHLAAMIEMALYQRVMEVRLRESERLLSDTARQPAEQEAWRLAHTDLARAGRLTTIGELTMSIAHEVNQPLMAIVTNAETCLQWLSGDRPDLGEARKAAERIVRDGHRASDFIRSVRALGQKATPQVGRVDINAAILDVLGLLRTEAVRRHIKIETNLPEDLPPAKGDRVQLQQVLLNLIVNAMEAMASASDAPDASELQAVGARVMGVQADIDPAGHIVVAVSDTGAGLDPAVAERVFEAFFTTKPEGVGLGLSICRTIVEAHGGTLWASSNQPRGSVFRFTLPLAGNQTAVDP